MSIKKLSLIIFVVLLGLYLFYLYFPFLLVGPPTAVFYIDNDDSISHDVTVEIFNEKNVSIFKKIYLLNSNESASFNRDIRWWFPLPSTLVTWSDGVYTFNFTVDYNYTKEITRDINQYETIVVDVFEINYPNILVPIKIGIIAV